MAFDDLIENPLEFDTYQDLHGDDSDDDELGAGVSALGGGGEYATGETYL